MDSTRASVLHDCSMPPPVLRQNRLDVIDSSADKDNYDNLPTTQDSDTTKDSILFSQKHLNDLIRDLSRLKEQNMVEKDVQVSYYRKCNRDLSPAFKVKGYSISVELM